MNDKQNESSFGIRSELASTLQDRPHVFPEKYWPVIRRAASHVIRYNASPSEILNKPWNNMLELTAAINDKVATSFTLDMEEDLVQTHSKTGEPIFAEDDKTQDSLVNAVVSRDISLLDTEDPDLRTTALGLAHVVDRARTDSIRSVLYGADNEALQKMGLDKKTATIAADLLGIFNKTNAEFLRFNAKGNLGVPLDIDAHPDVLPEYNLVASGLVTLIDKLQKVDKKSETDMDFITFMSELRSFFTTTTEGDVYVAHADMQKRDRLRVLKNAFSAFYLKHPEFPIVIASERFNYVGAAASDNAGEDLHMGDDPEIRILMQTPENQRRNEELKNRYAELLEQIYPTLIPSGVSELIKSKIPLETVDLGAYGVNLQRPAEQQAGSDEQDPFILIMTYPEIIKNFNDRSQVYLGELLPDPTKYEQVRSNDNFRVLKDLVIQLHEYGHMVYVLSGEPKDKMEDDDIQWYELKSDLLSMIMSSEVLAATADQMFPGQGREALNLAMITYIVDNYVSSSPTAEDAPYYNSGRTILATLSEVGLLKTVGDKIQLNEPMLKENLGYQLQFLGAEVLALYQQVSLVTSDFNVAALQSIGNSIVKERTNPAVDQLYVNLRAKLNE